MTVVCGEDVKGIRGACTNSQANERGGDYRAGTKMDGVNRLITPVLFGGKEVEGC